MAPRQLTVDGKIYRWQVSHRHSATSKGHSATGCRELFTAFLSGETTSPLHIWFSAGPTTGAGYPSHGSVYVWGEWSCNLHRPAVAAAVIRAAIATGWVPDMQRNPLKIEDGFSFLRKHLAPELLEALVARQEP